MSSDPNINAGLLNLGAKLAANPRIQALLQEEVEGWMLVEAPGGATFPVLRELHPTGALPPANGVDGEHKSDVADGGRTLPTSSSAPSALSSLGLADPLLLPGEAEVAEATTPRPETDAVPAAVVAAPAPTGFAGLLDWIQQKIDGLLSVLGSFTQRPAPAASAPPALADAAGGAESPPAPGAAVVQDLSASSAWAKAALGVSAVLIMFVVMRRVDPKLFLRLLHW